MIKWSLFRKLSQHEQFLQLIGGHLANINIKGRRAARVNQFFFTWIQGYHLDISHQDFHLSEPYFHFQTLCEVDII